MMRLIVDALRFSCLSIAAATGDGFSCQRVNSILVITRNLNTYLQLFYIALHKLQIFCRYLALEQGGSDRHDFLQLHGHVSA